MKKFSKISLAFSTAAILTLSPFVKTISAESLSKKPLNDIKKLFITDEKDEEKNTENNENPTINEILIQDFANAYSLYEEMATNLISSEGNALDIKTNDENRGFSEVVDETFINLGIRAYNILMENEDALNPITLKKLEAIVNASLEITGKDFNDLDKNNTKSNLEIKAEFENKTKATHLINARYIYEFIKKADVAIENKFIDNLAIIIQNELAESGKDFSALDTSGKKSNQEMSAEFEKTIKETHLKSAKKLFDLLEKEGNNQKNIYRGNIFISAPI